MFRLLFLTFFGDCRVDEHAKHHLHESPASMTMPLIVLGILSLIGGWIGLPEQWLWGDRFGEFLAPIFSGAHAASHLSTATESALMGASVLVAAIGFGVAYLFYLVQPGLPMLLAWKAQGAYNLIFNKYYVDELYDVLVVRPTVVLSNLLWRAVDAEVIDGMVNGTASMVGANSSLWRRLQTGNVQHYALSMLLGAMAILGYYALR